VTSAESAAQRYGPQYAGDLPFTARMRFHQSWWRADVLGVPFGTGPRKSSTSPYGNMLDPAAAEAGKNFLTPAIRAAAFRRMSEGGGVEPFRCTRNMLSSQPMCFNLFGALPTMEPGIAMACVAKLLPDPADCTNVERVVIEFAPAPKADFLDDRTAFDAFIEYRRADGSLGCIGVETKLTEPFSQKTDHADKYLRYTAEFPTVWSPDDRDALVDIRWFQLWRNHLLAKRLAAHPGHGYTSGRVLVVHHQLDPDCAGIVEDYRAHLVDPDREVTALSVWEIVHRWKPVLAATEHAPWLADFEARYVDLIGSEAAWEVSGRPSRRVLPS
jgi:hypothetical protein